MIGWLKQQYNDLLFKIFPLMPSDIVKNGMKEFDEKYKEFRVMTEKYKRFTLQESDIYNRNDVICDNMIELPQSTACDLLNELHDENQRLKLENDGLRYALKNIKKIDVEINVGDLDD